MPRHADGRQGTQHHYCPLDGKPGNLRASATVAGSTLVDDAPDEHGILRFRRSRCRQDGPLPRYDCAWFIEGVLRSRKVRCRIHKQAYREDGWIAQGRKNWREQNFRRMHILTACRAAAQRELPTK